MAEGQNNSDSKKNEAKSIVPPKSLSAEFWVGLFSLVGVSCFAYLSINIAGMKLMHSGYYHVTASFTNIAGLKIGAPVEIAGVPVGEVRTIRLNETDAEVGLDIREDVVLREDDIAQIRTKGIIGDKYIKISPGGADTQLKDSGVLKDTESAVEFEEIIGKVVHSLEK